MTSYTIHSARDNSIIAESIPSMLSGDIQEIAKMIAENNGANATHRLYVHNGVGIVGAVLVRQGAAHDILRDDFMRLEQAAREKRIEEGYEVYTR